MADPVEFEQFIERIQVLPRVLVTADATGEEVETWPDPDPPQEHWARMDTVSGAAGDGELPRGGKDTLRLKFRHEIPLTPADRVRFKDRGTVYAIVGVWKERAPNGRGLRTVCSCCTPTY